jgi:hypothetical protein
LQTVKVVLCIPKIFNSLSQPPAEIQRRKEMKKPNRIAQGPMYELFSLLLLLVMAMNTFHSLSLQQSKIAPLLSLPRGGQDCLQLTAIPQEKPYSS